MTGLVLQVLPVMLNIRHYSAQLEFFRSLAEERQTPQVDYLLAINYRACTDCHYNNTEGLAMLTFPRRWKLQGPVPACHKMAICVQGLCNFVDLRGEHLTESEVLVTALRKLGGESLSEAYPGSQLYGADHVIAPKGMTVSMLQAHQRANSTAVAILYGAVGSPRFKELHDTLMQSVERGKRALHAQSPQFVPVILATHSSDIVSSVLHFGHWYNRKGCSSSFLHCLGLVCYIVTHQDFA